MKLRSIFILISLFTLTISCAKEPVEPNEPVVPPTTVVAEDFDHIVIATDPSDVQPIDSLVYVNNTTGVNQTITASTSQTVTCDGVDSVVESFQLSNDYVSGDGCSIGIHYENSVDYKIFQVLLLKPSGSFCEDIGSQAGIFYGTNDYWLVEKNI